MSKREELKENDLEQVSGGKFTFYTDEGGTPRCTVTGYGTFTTTPQGVFSYMSIRNSAPGLSEDEYFQMCVNQGVIW